MMNFWAAYGMREVMPADWYGEGRLMAFGDMQCPVPSNWDAYLTSLYGDYMTPPAQPPTTHGHAFRLIPGGQHDQETEDKGQQR